MDYLNRGLKMEEFLVKNQEATISNIIICPAVIAVTMLCVKENMICVVTE